MSGYAGGPDGGSITGSGGGGGGGNGGGYHDKYGDPIHWDPRNGCFVASDGSEVAPQALSPAALHFFNANSPDGDHHHGHRGGGGDNTAGGSRSANGAEHSNNPVDVITSFFRSKGVPDYVIAGILSNLQHESSFNPTADGGPAFGIAQWQDSRLTEMRNWTAQHGLDSNSLDGQLAFLWHEMNTSESSSWHAVLNTSNAYDAGYAWASQYERCAHYVNGQDEWASRAQDANGFAQAGLSGSSYSGPPITSGGGDGGGNNSGRTPGSAAGFENSSWYKQHSDTARQVIAEQISDPASYQQQINNLVGNVQNAAHQLGWNLSPDQASQIATTALLTGNQTNQPWINQAISHLQDYSNIQNVDTLRGGMASTGQQLQQLALSYGLRVDPSVIAQQAQRVEAGFTTVDTFRNEYIRQAKSMFPALSDQLDQGLTVQDVAQPYIQSMSSLLEMDPSQIDLFSPKIRAALQGTQGQSQNGKSNPTLMPLWQFENQVRSDPRWGYTNNAHAQVSSTLMQLGQDWGFAA